MASSRAQRKYIPMLKGMTDLITYSDVIRIINIFKREDRIVWALNAYRRQVLEDNVDFVTDDQERLLAHLQRRNIPVDFGEVAETLELFNHYFVQYGKFDSLVFKNADTCACLLARLENMETKLLSKSTSSDRLLDEAGVIIVDVSDTLKWFDLQRGGCRLEGRAQNHCGNGNGLPGETIYSLREKVTNKEGATKWVPHATFIFQKKNGSLGEMKGRFNQKPTLWHDAIVQLLIERKEIRMLWGGGYKPENNFALKDLSPDLLKQVEHERIDLLGVVRSFNDDERDSVKCRLLACPNLHPVAKFLIESGLHEKCLAPAHGITQKFWVAHPRELLNAPLAQLEEQNLELINYYMMEQDWLDSYLDGFKQLSHNQKSIARAVIETILNNFETLPTSTLTDYLKELEGKEGRFTSHSIPKNSLLIVKSLAPSKAVDLLKAA